MASYLHSSRDRGRQIRQHADVASILVTARAVQVRDVMKVAR